MPPATGQAAGYSRGVWSAARVLEEAGRRLGALPEGRGTVQALKAIIKDLERLPPSRERDGLLALAYLRLYRVERREEYLLRGYSYARTSRLEGPRLLAERILKEKR